MNHSIVLLVDIEFQAKIISRSVLNYPSLAMTGPLRKKFACHPVGEQPHHENISRSVVYLQYLDIVNPICKLFVEDGHDPGSSIVDYVEIAYYLLSNKNYINICMKNTPFYLLKLLI